jgi:hypothetical protein
VAFDIRKALVWVRDHYDRLIAFGVLLALLGSLLYLAIRVGMVRTMQDQFDHEIGAMRPAHEHAGELDTAPFERAEEEIRSPRRLAAWETPLLSPEARVWCPDCRRPIPYAAKTCPFCGAAQREDPDTLEDFDGDGDRMWDSWERKYNLNPKDPADAAADPDGDGFTNLEEFLGNPKTDPRNPEDSPPLVVKLRLVRIETDPFRLRFRGLMTLPDGSMKFQINLRDNSQTYFRKLDEEIEGFKLAKYEEKFETKAGGTAGLKKDVSELTLQRGDKTIRLVKGQDVQYDEYVAHLAFAVDNTEIAKRVGETFTLRGRKYQVIDIDSRRERVLIRSLQDGKEAAIERLPAGGVSGSVQREG